MLIPLSNSGKNTCDAGVIVGALIAYFKLIPWAELAACIAFIIGTMRLIDIAVCWWTKRERKSDD